MLDQGVPLEVISKTLGHSGLAITADIYAAVTPPLQRHAATAMDSVLGSVTSGGWSSTWSSEGAEAEHPSTANPLPA
jgi:hypothetical protein